MSALERSNPAAIVNSQDGQRLGARIEPTGEVSLEIPGAGRVNWQTALRSGFIAPRYGQVPAPGSNAPHVALLDAALTPAAKKAAAPQAQQQQAALRTTQYPQPSSEHVAKLRETYANRSLPLQQRLALEKSWDSIYGKGSAAKWGYTH
jgi:hypothetical protein